MTARLFSRMNAEIRTALFWRAIAAEFVGTALFIFIHHGATSIFPASGYSEVRNALAAGFAIATFVLCTSHISGGHFNPVVSFCFMVFNFITPVKAFLYTAAQIGGATFGAFLIKVTTPHAYNPTTAATVLGPGVTPAQGVLIEGVLTFQLLFMIFAAVVDEDRSDVVGSKPLAIGLSVAMGILCGVNYTGASMNPARSVSSAIVGGTWDDHWIYWVGPFMGGPLGAITYRWILDPNAHPKRIAQDSTRCCRRTGTDNAYAAVDQHDAELKTRRKPQLQGHSLRPNGQEMAVCRSGRHRACEDEDVGPRVDTPLRDGSETSV